MQESLKRSMAIAALGLALLSWGCPGDNIVSLRFGFIEVTTVTTGSNLDADGYLLRVTGPSLDWSQRLSSNDTVTVTVTRAGTYTAALEEVAGTCSVEVNPRSVAVVLETTSRVTFNVTCS